MDKISIHAPVKGATLVFFFSQTKHTNFNPRSREGSDIPPQNLIISKINFNPRSREGSDQGDLRFSVFEDISIHAPVKGATMILWSIRF